MRVRQIWCLYQFLFNAVSVGKFVRDSHQEDGQSISGRRLMQLWLTSISHTSWAGCPLLPTTKGLLCAKPFSGTNKHAHIHSRHRQDKPQCAPNRETKAHPYIHTIGVYTPAACLLQTIFVMINSFHKPRDFPISGWDTSCHGNRRKQRFAAWGLVCWDKLHQSRELRCSRSLGWKN